MSTTTNPADVVITTEAAELRQFLKRAQSGDASTLPALRKMLENPAMVGVCGGNLAEQAERSFIEAAAGKNLAFREALVRKLELMRDELGGPNPTPLERLLVGRVVACWLQVQDADVRYAQGQKDCALSVGEYQQRRMDRAHKRYLSAIKTLALVRKLALPILQVNIAKKQVNVAGPCVAPGTEKSGDEKRTIQKARAGEDVPPPAALDVTVNGEVPELPAAGNADLPLMVGSFGISALSSRSLSNSLTDAGCGSGVGRVRGSHDMLWSRQAKRRVLSGAGFAAVIAGRAEPASSRSTPTCRHLDRNCLDGGPTRAYIDEGRFDGRSVQRWWYRPLRR